MPDTETARLLRLLLSALHARRRVIAQSAGQAMGEANDSGTKTDWTGFEFGVDIEANQRQIESVQRAIDDEVKMAQPATLKPTRPLPKG